MHFFTPYLGHPKIVHFGLMPVCQNFPVLRWHLHLILGVLALEFKAYPVDKEDWTQEIEGATGATGCPSWCRPLHPLFHFLCSILFIHRVFLWKHQVHSQDDTEWCISMVLSSANFSPRGCVNPASWLCLAAETSFTQPLREKCSIQNTEYCKNRFWE